MGSPSELEEELRETGNVLLLSPPLSTADQLLLLQKLNSCLKKVNQSPSSSMRSAIVPAMNALLAYHFVNSWNNDVSVSVAACFCQIARVTAPNPPYSDESMQDIFRVIVGAFENLCDMSDSLYERRVSILHTFAKTQMCNLMVDLDCNQLVLDMFKHFFSNIRENHPDDVFLSMGLIMILTLVEIEKVPQELLSYLLDILRMGNQEVLPIARKLAERVIQNCDFKLAPLMSQAMQRKGFPLDDYCETVGIICEQSDTYSRRPDDLEGYETSKKIMEIDSQRASEIVGSSASLQCPHRHLSHMNNSKGIQGLDGNGLGMGWELSFMMAESSLNKLPAKLSEETSDTRNKMQCTSSVKVEAENTSGKKNSVFREAKLKGDSVKNKSAKKQMGKDSRVVSSMKMKSSARSCTMAPVRRWSRLSEIRTPKEKSQWKETSNKFKGASAASLNASWGHCSSDDVPALDVCPELENKLGKKQMEKDSGVVSSKKTKSSARSHMSPVKRWSHLRDTPKAKSQWEQTSTKREGASAVSLNASWSRCSSDDVFALDACLESENSDIEIIN